MYIENKINTYIQNEWEKYPYLPIKENEEEYEVDLDPPLTLYPDPVPDLPTEDKYEILFTMKSEIQYTDTDILLIKDKNIQKIIRFDIINNAHPHVELYEYFNIEKTIIEKNSDNIILKPVYFKNTINKELLDDKYCATLVYLINVLPEIEVKNYNITFKLCVEKIFHNVILEKNTNITYNIQVI